MDRRAAIGISALSLGTLAVGYALFAPVSDEELIAALLDDVAAAVSFAEPLANPVIWGTQLSGKFEDLLSDPIDIRLAEVSSGIPRSLGRLGLAAATVLSRYGSLDVTLSSMRITVNGDSATVQAKARLIGVVYGEMRRDTRPVSFELSRESGDWLVTAIEAHPAQD